ncbi:hypothetical protein D3C80_2049060 [compost metagenome]
MGCGVATPARQPHPPNRPKPAKAMTAPASWRALVFSPLTKYRIRGVKTTASPVMNPAFEGDVS